MGLRTVSELVSFYNKIDQTILCRILESIYEGFAARFFSLAIRELIVIFVEA